MSHARITLWLPVFLAGLAGLLLLSGCGGGTGSTPAAPKWDYRLANPIEDATKPSMVGGTIYTMAPRPGDTAGIIDQAYQAAVTLTGTTDDGGAYTMQTFSTVRGGYQFTDVPPGTYAVRASIQSPHEAGVTLVGEVTNVRARGNIPSLMINLLLCEEARQAVFTGAITEQGHAAAGAVVSVDITGYTPQYQLGDTLHKSSVILSTNTDAAGQYRIVVPSGGLGYYVAAHSDTSMVSESPEILQLLPGETHTVNLLLDPAETPQFATMLLDIVSTTLPAATAQASEQTMITRLAVARALRAPQERIARLEKLARSRTTSRAAVIGIYENDVYWTLLSGDVGVRGFHVYRATEEDGPYTYIGSARDPYLMNFFDNDPALAGQRQMFYTAASYAANGQMSSLAKAIRAVPLDPITVIGPADGARVPVNTAEVSWQPVSGALCYVVTKFDTPPAFNALPVGTTVIHGPTDTAEILSGLPAGDYWWSVSAYNTQDPDFATAVAYSAYRKITLE